MFWKPRKDSYTIPAELHEKLVRSCDPINSVDSEVVRVRNIRPSQGCPTGDNTRRHRMLVVAQ